MDHAGMAENARRTAAGIGRIVADVRRARIVAASIAVLTVATGTAALIANALRGHLPVCLFIAAAAAAIVIQTLPRLADAGTALKDAKAARARFEAYAEICDQAAAGTITDAEASRRADLVFNPAAAV